MPENNKLLISQSFNSFEELAVIAHSWNADFRQFSPSETDHQILQVMMDGILMSRGRFGCHLDQHGSTPADLRTFALLEENCTPVYWFGRKAGPDTLLVFPTHGEIEAVSRPGFCNHTFSVSMDDLGNFFERSGGPDISRVLGPGAASVPIPHVHLQRLRAHLREISFDQVTLHQSLALYDAYRDKLFGILQDIFNGEDTYDHLPRHLARRKSVGDILAVIRQNKYEPLSIEDLSVVGKVPERTLNEICRREFGISPGAFIKGYRLFGVHRELWRSGPSSVHVTDVANAWGFWHMGQFAADYRKMFAELPSMTLKRSI